MLKSVLNFEVAVDQLRENKEYTDQHRVTFHKALIDAFENLDNILKEPINDVALADLHTKLLLPFLGIRNEEEKGFIFTLNQDLFFERHLYNFHMRPGLVFPCLPGIASHQSWFTSHPWPLDKEHYRIPDLEGDVISRVNENLFNKNSRSFIIKLHGSQNWWESKEMRMILVGRDKAERMPPLLKAYLGIFKEALTQPQRKLLIIGYGFGDEHINSVIAEGVETHGLELYVVSPKNPLDFKIKLTGIAPQTPIETIWSGLRGYLQSNLREMFQTGGRGPSQKAIIFLKQFFQI